jgi:hypothetical protein
MSIRTVLLRLALSLPALALAAAGLSATRRHPPAPGAPSHLTVNGRTSPPAIDPGRELPGCVSELVRGSP